MSECEGLLYITIAAFALAILFLLVEKWSTRQLLKELQEYGQAIEPAAECPAADPVPRTDRETRKIMLQTRQLTSAGFPTNASATENHGSPCKAR